MHPDAPLAGTIGAHTAEGGWLVLDDGTRLPYDAAAVAPRVRLLHPGQRVALRVRDGAVLALTLAGMPLPH